MKELEREVEISYQELQETLRELNKTINNEFLFKKPWKPEGVTYTNGGFSITFNSKEEHDKWWKEFDELTIRELRNTIPS
jgi:hypothetical protein